MHLASARLIEDAKMKGQAAGDRREAYGCRKARNHHREEVGHVHSLPIVTALARYDAALAVFQSGGSIP